MVLCRTSRFGFEFFNGESVAREQCQEKCRCVPLACGVLIEAVGWLLWRLVCWNSRYMVVRIFLRILLASLIWQTFRKIFLILTLLPSLVPLYGLRFGFGVQYRSLSSFMGTSLKLSYASGLEPWVNNALWECRNHLVICRLVQFKKLSVSRQLIKTCPSALIMFCKQGWGNLDSFLPLSMHDTDAWIFQIILLHEIFSQVCYLSSFQKFMRLLLKV